jgi:hypothetical protein
MVFEKLFLATFPGMAGTFECVYKVMFEFMCPGLLSTLIQMLLCSCRLYMGHHLSLFYIFMSSTLRIPYIL